MKNYISAIDIMYNTIVKHEAAKKHPSLNTSTYHFFAEIICTNEANGQIYKCLFFKSKQKTLT